MAKSEAKGAETASPSNEVTQPNEAQEAQHTDGPNSAASTTEQQEREQAARLVIEYDDEAAAAWEQVQDLPSEYSSRFLDTLGANPEQDPAALAASLHEEHQKLIRPYDNDEVNDALAQARTISSDAETEFRKAYALVGTRVSPDGILVKVEEKFGPTELTKQRLEQEERELREREAAVQKAEEQRKTKEQVRHLYEESRRRRPPEQHAANARALQMGDRWRKQDDEDVAALLRRAPINAERRRVERNLALAYLSIFLLMVFFLFLAFSS